MSRHRTSELYFTIRRHKASEAGSTIAEIAKGQADAERTVDRLNRTLTERERDEGWGHYWVRIPRDEGRMRMQAQMRAYASRRR